MECAALCCKLPWCTMYSLAEGGNTSDSKVSRSGSCQLFMDTSECSTASVSASNPPVCIKEIDGNDSVVTGCMKTSQRVLEVVDSKPNLLVHYTYLRNLISLGFNFVVQFVNGTSRYIAEASYLKMDYGASGNACLFILDYMSKGAFSMTVQTFCSDGVRLSNDSASPPTSDPFYWQVQIPQIGKMATNRKVFRPGDNYSDLISATEAGADFKLFFMGNKKLVHADVILAKGGNKISVQSRVRENGQMNLLSHVINGSTETLTWDQSNSALSGPTSENLQTILLSNSCWRPVFSTPDNSTSQSALKSAIESGRRIRVRFPIDSSLVVLATADYVQINSTSGMVTAFFLRVLVQKSFLLDVLSDLVKSALGLATQNQTKWTHYLVTSDGKAAIFTTAVGSSEGTVSSVASDVQWFEEVRDWQLVHSSKPSNSTSLALLAAEVLNGSEVRVKVQFGSIQKWFSCDAMEVNETDPNVKCHISSHISTNITGSSSIIPWLSELTTGSQCTIKSECFVVAAAELTTAVTSPCLWSSKEVLGNPMRADKVDWFVSR
ncbi:hypothetical protein BsWGS_10835 [Bradybaena similaris]